MNLRINRYLSNIIKVIILTTRICLIPFTVWVGHSQAATYYIDPGCAYPGDGTTTSCTDDGDTSNNAKNDWTYIKFACGNSYLQKAGTTWSVLPDTPA